MRRGIGGLDLEALGIPTEVVDIRRHGERTGRSHVIEAALADWISTLPTTRSWLAANLQGVAKRELDGMASSDLAQQSGAQAPARAELGWRFAARRHR
jgi:hypothetical protein